MDDLFLISPDIPTAQTLLNRCVFALNWAGMKFRTSKSRSIVIDHGKVKNICPFEVITEEGKDPEFVPSIHAKPIKFLGRVINASLSDSAKIEEFITLFLQNLERIDKSGLRGIHKVWVLEHLLIPQIRWPFLIYEVSLTRVRKLEQKVASLLRKWFKLHPSITNISLFSASSPCPLPLKSLSSVLKSTKVSGHLLLRDSKDPLVASSNPDLKSGNWRVADAVKCAEEKLAFRDILGYHQSNRAGFGSKESTKTPSRGTHDYRKLISSLVNEEEEEKLVAKSVQLHLQGNWTKWCNYIKNDLSWKTLLAQPQCLTSFCIGATFDTLPSPSNLHRWSINESKSCNLCNKNICTTAHILSGCQTALDHGRFTYRHNSILAEIADSLRNFLESYDPSMTSVNISEINFVKEGTYVPLRKKKPVTGILHKGDDWKLLVDLDPPLVVPPCLAITSKRPDIVLFSRSSRICVIIELTSPCEENFEVWHKKKINSYFPLCTAIRENGWVVHFFAVEVGARGYCSESVRCCLHQLGFSNKLCRSSLKSFSLCASKCSFYIWLSRTSKEWERPEDPKGKNFTLIHSDKRLSCLNSKASVSSNIPSVYSSKSCSRQKIPSKTPKKKASTFTSVLNIFQLQG